MVKIICLLLVVGFFLALPSSGFCTPEVIARESPLLRQKLKTALLAKGPDYKPRTRHLLGEGQPKYTNRLILEGSPYLLQHAHNPVNWYAWGDAAFAAAKRLGLPILLSIGYSTCHWCHVMEEESFEDEEIAQYLNEHYIAIKVDREERPDLDSIYMAAVQTITGRGGWPMTVWLLPDRQPFYGGTYFPARDGDRGRAQGFLSIIKKISTLYQSQPDEIQEAGTRLTKALRQQLKPVSGGHLPGTKMISEVMVDCQARFDPVYGGTLGQPKFPSSMPIRLLLRYYRRTGDEKILSMARLSLDKMAAGGIYDQVGGGFHRYATDKEWLVPHFEKMLYDNALLVRAYLEGFQVTGDENYRRIVEEVLLYVKRDMTSSDGAFYSATDADSLNLAGHREEGYYFTWTPAELEKILGPDQARVVKVYYGVGAKPNFEGRYILHRPAETQLVAKKLGLTEPELLAIIKQARATLYQHRNHRLKPLRDEKILTAWNGLMISAYARAGLILGNQDYTDSALKAADFILKNLYREGQLYRSYKDAKARHTAYLDDYAFFIAALIDLYEVTHNSKWLEQAIRLDEVLQSNYEDHQPGGFFMTARGQEGLIAREKPSYDGAEPSGNSVALLNLLRLSEYTSNDNYRIRAEKMLSLFLGGPAVRPMAQSEMLLALDFHTDRVKEIVIISAPGKLAEAERYLVEFRRKYLPNCTLTVAGEGQDLESHTRLVPLVKGKLALKGATTAYVCEDGICQLPATTPAIFARQIGAVHKLVSSGH